MGKYNNKQIPETKLADHKRVCRTCGLISYHWLCCKQRTARFQAPTGVIEIKNTKEEKP
jgi:hypothetical protein